MLHGEIEPPELGHDERLLVRDAAALAESSTGRRAVARCSPSGVKAATGKKGRELFHPLRLALTGRESGPEMAGLVSRMGKERDDRRLEAAARR